MLGAAGKKDRIVVSSERFNRNIAADVRVGQKVDALRAHLLQAAIEDVFLELEIGNAVAEQAADAVVFFVHGYGVAGAAKLLRGGKSGGTAADDGDALAGVVLRRLGMDPSLVPCALDDAALDEFDGDRRLIDAEHAGSFAGRGTDAAGELGEVVGRVQAANRALPAAVVDEVVPVGDEIVDRATGVAEGNAAVHAAGALLALFLFGKRLINFKPVLHALFNLRRVGCSRSISRNPVTLPMLHLGCCCLHLRRCNVGGQ